MRPSFRGKSCACPKADRHVFFVVRHKDELVRQGLTLADVIAWLNIGLYLIVEIIPVVQPGCGQAAYSSKNRASAIEL